MMYAVCVWPKRGGMVIGWVSANDADAAMDRFARELHTDKDRWPPGEYTAYVHAAPTEDEVRTKMILRPSADSRKSTFVLVVDADSPTGRIEPTTT